MAVKVTVDLDVCQGYAMCMMEAPNVFDIDVETGKAILLMEVAGEEERTAVEKAVRACPAKAIQANDV